MSAFVNSIDAIAEQALRGKGCSRQEALHLASDDISLSVLMHHAEQIRAKHHGDVIQFCAIVNARSGACSQDCRFCAQSVHHDTDAEVYGLQDADTLVAAAKAMEDSGASTFGLVTSGPTVPDEELAALAEAIGRVRDETTLKPCASLGALTVEQLARLKEAGLTRFHHNLETARTFFPQVCTTHTWEARCATVKAAQVAGLEVCCGGLFGLGESWADRVDLGLTLRELAIESVPINFLNPVPGTPLQDQPRLSAAQALRIIAVYRFLLPKATLRICGGRPTVLGERQEDMFRAGANALMTGDYLTTAGLSPETDRKMVQVLGLTVAARS